MNHDINLSDKLWCISSKAVIARRFPDLHPLESQSSDISIQNTGLLAFQSYKQ